MANKLIIIDQQQLQYENEILKLTVLAGIRLEGLNRMRVTIKVEYPNPGLVKRCLFKRLHLESGQVK